MKPQALGGIGAGEVPPGGWDEGIAPQRGPAPGDPGHVALKRVHAPSGRQMIWKALAVSDGEVAPVLLGNSWANLPPPSRVLAKPGATPLAL